MRHGVLTHMSACVASLAVVACAVHGAQNEAAKLLPSDGGANDFFANSVAISGTLVIAGASYDDDNGTDSGEASLFDVSNPAMPIQVAKLLPDDGASSDQFGFSVAISGTMVIVGAFGDDDNGSLSGSAYLFDVSNPAMPMQVAKLLPDDGSIGDVFGYSVGLTSTTAIIGARQDDDKGMDSGSAYLFDVSNPALPAQTAKLLQADGAPNDWFGYSVALSGTTAIVGAYRDDDNGFNSGSASLYDIASGFQVAKLVPADGGAGHSFGISVALSGTTAIVGAPGDDDNGIGSGTAYLYDVSTPTMPLQLTKLLSDDGAAADEFGRSVALSGATAIVGARRDADNGMSSGSAYFFDVSTPAMPVQLAKLLPSDGAAMDEFGSSVAISGTMAVAGAPNDDENGTFSGSAYLFNVIAPCDGDVNGDGVVNFDDLNLVLSNWECGT